MQLPTIHFLPDCRPYITGRHLFRAASAFDGETFLYEQEQGLGLTLASVSKDYVMMSYRAESESGSCDVHQTLVRGGQKEHSLRCPGCKRDARRLWIGPFQCGLCVRIHDRIGKALFDAVTHKPTDEELAERHRREVQRWANLSHDERIQELEVRLTVAKWMKENDG